MYSILLLYMIASFLAVLIASSMARSFRLDIWTFFRFWIAFSKPVSSLF